MIELLVVLVIIALLSSVIFSSMTKVRMRARDAARVATARNVTQALSMYEVDKGNVTSLAAGPNCDGSGVLNVAGATCPSIAAKQNTLGDLSRQVVYDTIYSDTAYYLAYGAGSSTWQVYIKLEDPSKAQNVGTLTSQPGGTTALSTGYYYASGPPPDSSGGVAADPSTVVVTTEYVALYDGLLTNVR